MGGPLWGWGSRAGGVQGWELPRTPTAGRGWHQDLGLASTHVPFFSLKQEINNNNDKRQHPLKAEITRIPVQISLEGLKCLFGNKEEGAVRKCSSGSQWRGRALQS